MIPTNELIDMYLTARIGSLKLYLENPDIPAHCPPLAPLGFEPISNQEGLAEFKRLVGMLEEYRGLEAKVLILMEAQKLVGKRVVKKSRKPFQSGASTVVVRSIINHPYRPGWSLACVFQVDGSCVSVDQLREYHGQ